MKLTFHRETVDFNHGQSLLVQGQEVLLRVVFGSDEQANHTVIGSFGLDGDLVGEGLVVETVLACLVLVVNVVFGVFDGNTVGDFKIEHVEVGEEFVHFEVGDGDSGECQLQPRKYGVRSGGNASIFHISFQIIKGEVRGSKKEIFRAAYLLTNRCTSHSWMKNEEVKENLGPH